jgi:hypothetical protein
MPTTTVKFSPALTIILFTYDKAPPPPLPPIAPAPPPPPPTATADILEMPAGTVKI